jgi:hypothetical protein
MLEKIQKHWNENSSWTMTIFMYQVVMKATRAIIKATHYITFSFGKVYKVHNPFWLYIHYYVMEN